MIRMVFTIEEQKDGMIRFRGGGEDVGGSPTKKEVSFAEDIMKLINKEPAKFIKTHEVVPLTIIKWKKKNERKNRR